MLLGSLNGAFQAALFPDCCLFFRDGAQFGKCSLPGLPLVGTRPFLDDNATLHFQSSTGLLVLNQKGERKLKAGQGRVDVRMDGSQWIFCDETETRGLLGGASKLFQMTLATDKSKLVYFETRSKPEWATSPKFEYLLVGEPRRGKLALHLILVAEESVVGEFELAKPRDLQIEDGGLMLLEFGDSTSPEWVLCRSQGGKLQSAQWKPPPGTRRGWPTKTGAMAVTDQQVIRLGLQGQGMQQVRIADRTVAKLWDVVPSSGPQGAQLLVWESGRLLLLPLWESPGPVKPALALEELLTHMSQVNCRGAWLEPARKCMLDNGQAWGDVVTEADLRGWVDQARRYAGSAQSTSFRRRALNHEYTISVVDQPRPGLRVQKVDAGPESM